MDLGDQLKRLAEGHARRPFDLEDIELRARRARRKATITISVTILVLLVAISPVAINLWSQARRGAAMGSDSPTQTEEQIASQAAGPTPTESPSLSQAECDKFDSCNEDEDLAHAAGWLGSALQQANLDYINDYREDGGGGHYVRRWNIMISVLRPTRATDEAQAAFLKYGDPSWSHQGTAVFASVDQNSPVAYFYWRAGGVDTFVHIEWQGSAASEMRDLKPPFDSLIDAQQEDPYFENYQS